MCWWRWGKALTDVGTAPQYREVPTIERFQVSFENVVSWLQWRTGVCGSRSMGSVKLDDVTLFCVELLSLKLSGKSSSSRAAETFDIRK